MCGDVDLARETQNLRVRVVPSLGDTASHRARDRQPGCRRRRGDRAERAQESARPDLRLRLRGERQLDRSQGGQDRHRGAPPPNRAESAVGQRKIAIAAVQMVSAPEVGAEPRGRGARLDRRGRGSGRAARRAAGELLHHRPARRRQGEGARARRPRPIQDFLARSGAEAPRLAASAARRRSKRADRGPHPQRLPACSTTAATRVARYDKMHLFRFAAGDERYDEARTVEPGERAGRRRQPVRPARTLGLLRCALSRALSRARRVRRSCSCLPPSPCRPARRIGRPLLRARAIENQAYVVAPAQGGAHASGRRTYGHTMIVDPWGEVLGVRAEGEGVVLAEIDPDASSRGASLRCRRTPTGELH